MKLLYLHDQYYNDQKANMIQVISMCCAFSNQGLDVHLALLDNGMSAQEIKEKIEKRYDLRVNFNIVCIPTYFLNTRIGRYLSTFFIKKIIKMNTPDICYIRSPIFLSPCISTGVKTIFESHTARLHNRISFLDKLWRRKIINLSANAAFLKLVTISNALREYWVALGIEQNKTMIAHDGFSNLLFSHPISRKAARQKLHFPINKKIVVYTGSLYPDREIETILLLAEKFIHALFLVVGGPEKNKLYYQNIAEEKGIGNIIFIGKVNHKNIPDYLYSGDVLLALWSLKVPTINYCSPLKIFEYMAAGRVIVAHSFPTIKEILSNEKTALLANPHSNSHLFHKVSYALSMENSNGLSTRVKKMAFDKYTWDIRARSIMSQIQLA